jgi:hypothetical protein
VTCGDAFVAKLANDGPTVEPAISLNVAPLEALPGGTVTATWAGIPNPTTDDQIYLLKLGGAGHGPFILGTFSTTGTAAGSVSVTLPSTLGPGAYELRLYTLDEDRAPLLKPVAGSEPVSILDMPATVVSALEPGNVLHLRVSGLAEGTYHVEATERIEAPDWHVIGSLTPSASGKTDFTDPISTVRSGRFYRISK